VGVDDQTQLTERGKRAVDRRAVDSGSGSFSAGNDLVGSEVFFRAVKNFDDRSAGPGDPLMLIPQRIQRHLDTGRHRRRHPRFPSFMSRFSSERKCDTVASGESGIANVVFGGVRDGI
jgi:hypothetical protein